MEAKKLTKNKINGGIFFKLPKKLLNLLFDLELLTKKI
jgi:hypothetical protein